MVTKKIKFDRISLIMTRKQHRKRKAHHALDLCIGFNFFIFIMVLICHIKTSRKRKAMGGYNFLGMADQETG